MSAHKASTKLEKNCLYSDFQEIGFTYLNAGIRLFLVSGIQLKDYMILNDVTKTKIKSEKCSY